MPSRSTISLSSISLSPTRMKQLLDWRLQVGSCGSIRRSDQTRLTLPALQTSMQIFGEAESSASYRHPFATTLQDDSHARGHLPLTIQSDDGCTSRMTWPVDSPDVIRAFDQPSKPWLAGHRGVDLAAESGDRIIAPAEGTVSFSGSVAGKSVVSITHTGRNTGLVSTFEPASSSLAVGTMVRRGQAVATVEGESDHCTDTCLHWGIKRAGANTSVEGRTQYLDPHRYATAGRIGLKPAT